MSTAQICIIFRVIGGRIFSDTYPGGQAEKTFEEV